MKVIGRTTGNKLLVEASADELQRIAGHASQYDATRKLGGKGEIRPGMTVEIHDNWRLLELVLLYNKRGSFYDLRSECERVLDKLNKLDSMEFFGFTEEEDDDD